MSLKILCLIFLDGLKLKEKTIKKDAQLQLSYVVIIVYLSILTCTMLREQTVVTTTHTCRDSHDRSIRKEPLASLPALLTPQQSTRLLFIIVIYYQFRPRRAQNFNNIQFVRIRLKFPSGILSFFSIIFLFRLCLWIYSVIRKFGMSNYPNT